MHSIIQYLTCASYNITLAEKVNIGFKRGVVKKVDTPNFVTGASAHP